MRWLEVGGERRAGSVMRGERGGRHCRKRKLEGSLNLEKRRFYTLKFDF